MSDSISRWLADTPNSTSEAPVTPGVPTPTSGTSIDDWLGQKPVPALNQTIDTNPDEYVEQKRLSTATGLSMEAVKADPEQVRRADTLRTLQASLTDVPITSAWMADVDNAQTAHDSVDQLGSVERLLKGLSTVIGPVRSAAAAAPQIAGQTAAAIGEIDEIAQRTGERLWRLILPSGLMDEAMQAQKSLGTIKDITDPVANSLKGVAQFVDVAPEDRGFVNDVAGGVGQVATQIAIAIATGGASSAISVFTMFAQGVDQVAEDVKKGGAEDTLGGDVATVGGGFVTALTEKYGLDILLNKLPAHVKSRIFRVLAGAGTEAAQEILEKTANNLVAIATYNEQQSIFDTTTLYEGSVAGTVGAVVSLAIPGKNARQAKTTMDKVQKDLSSSPLAQRDPDKAVDHATKALDANNVEVLVPVEKLTAVLGDKPEVYDELGITQDQLRIAQESGGDVHLSNAAFARLMLDEGKYEALAEDFRYGADAATAAETEAEADKEAETKGEPDIAKIKGILDEADATVTESSPAERALSEFVGHAPGAKNLDPESAPIGVFSTERLEAAVRDPKSEAGKELEAKFAPIRERLRAELGDVVKLYRVQRDPAEGAQERTLLSWTLDPKFADAHAGTFRERPEFTEEQIQKYEKKFAETGEVKITTRVTLKKEPNPMGGEDMIVLYEDGDNITDVDSVRGHIEEMNEDRRETKRNNDEKRKKIITAEVPLNDVVWATDRANQTEFIVRNTGAAGVTTKGKPKPDKWHKAAEEAVDAAEEAVGLKGLLETGKQAGMTEAQAESFLLAKATEREAAINRVKQALLKQQARENTAEWKAERDVERAKVVESLNQEPVYASLNSLGQQRLDKAATIEALEQAMGGRGVYDLKGDPAVLEMLPKHMGRVVYEPRGGVHPDVVAQQYGFADGVELVTAIANAVPLDVLVETTTDQNMYAKHGTLFSKGIAIDEAIKALHSGEAAKLLASELDAMRGAGKAVKPEAVRRVAKRNLREMIVGDIHPKVFINAWKRKAEEAGKLLRGTQASTSKKTGVQKPAQPTNRSGAVKAKFQQLLNFEYAREAYAVQQKVQKQAKYLRRMADPSRDNSAVDADHMDQIRALLAPYNFNSTKPTGEAATHAKHYTKMALKDFQAVYAEAKFLEQQGKKWKALLIEGKQRDFDHVKGLLLAQAETLPDHPVEAKRDEQQNLRRFDRARQFISGLSSYVAKVEYLLSKLDGGLNGPWSRAVFKPIADAQTAELDMMDKVILPLLKGQAALSKADQKWMRTNRYVEWLGRKMTGSELTMVLLNMGNASNTYKTSKGYNWTEEAMLEAVQDVPPGVAKWVQGVWDRFEALRPQIEEIFRNQNGRSPERIEPMEIEVGGVKLRGGYFPMTYDPQRRPAKSFQSTEEALKDPFIMGSVFSGMTEDRVETFAAPVLLDIENLNRSLMQSIHYVTHFDAHDNVKRVLDDKDLAAAMQRKLGVKNQNELQRWLEAVATNNTDRSENAEMKAAVKWVRGNITPAVLGFSYTTMMSQTMGLIQSVAVLGRAGGKFSPGRGVKWMMVGMDHYLADPRGATRTVMELSGEMRHRLGNADRDIRNSLGELAGKMSTWAQIKKAGMYSVGAAQFYTVDVPTWLGAYNQHLAENPAADEAAAVDYADAVLRTSQASGHLKDLSGLQRKKGLAELATMFSTFTMLQFNMIQETAADMKKLKSLPGATARLSFILVGGAVVDALLRMQMPQEDDEPEEKAGWWAARVARYSLQSVPIVGNPLSSVWQGYDMATLKLDTMGKKIIDGIRAAWKVFGKDDDLTLKEGRKMLEGMGYAFGAPGTAQLGRVLKAIEAGDDATYYDYLIGYDTAKNRAK